MSTMMRTEAPPSFGEVRFRRDGVQLCVERATPVMWFPRHVLDERRAAPDVGLSFDGSHVTLRAANGEWIWRLTGRTWCRDYVSDAESLVMCEGVWPD